LAVGVKVKEAAGKVKVPGAVFGMVIALEVDKGVVQEFQGNGLGQNLQGFFLLWGEHDKRGQGLF